MSIPSFRLRLRGLIVASFLAASCGGDSYNTPSPTTPTGGASADVTITIQGQNGGMSFSPAAASVRVGQTVGWRNADSTTHTATQDGGRFNTGNIGPGGTSSPIAMTAAGAFPYHCSIHPSMVATLTVNP
jgi:plastocyanin